MYLKPYLSLLKKTSVTQIATLQSVMYRELNILYRAVFVWRSQVLGTSLIPFVQLLLFSLCDENTNTDSVAL